VAKSNDPNLMIICLLSIINTVNMNKSIMHLTIVLLRQ